MTLIETLVAIGAIAVLLGMLLPAILRVRESSSKTQCANNLRQIALAAHQHHDARQMLPIGMKWDQGRSPRRFSSWLLQILPYLEQASLWSTSESAYQQWNLPFKNPPHVGLSTVIPVFACPSDGRVSQPQISKREGYLVALTSYLGVSGTNVENADGVLFRDSKIAMRDITDGTANTLLAGERPPSADFQFGWWYAGVGQNGTGSADMFLGVFEKNIQTVTEGSCAPGYYPFGPGRFDDRCDMYHFWSPHSGDGAYFAFVDGSARFLAYSSNTMLTAISTRNAGDASPSID